MTRQERDEDELRERARAALDAGACPYDEAILDAIATHLGGLARDIGAVRERMISMGRRLLRLQEAAGEGGYKALRTAGLVPIPEASASRLRTIALAVEERRIPPDAMPHGLNAAYAASRLPGPEAERLIEAGELGPHTTARQIEEAARPTGGGGGQVEASLPPTDRQRLERRLTTIRVAMARLEAEAAGIEARLARDTPTRRPGAVRRAARRRGQGE